jgi:hypothetical protein
MNCRKARSLLSAFTKNELSHSVNERLVQHLDNCPACKKASVVAEQINQTIRHLPKAELSDDFNMRLFERIHNAPRGVQLESAHLPRNAPSGFVFRIKYAAPVIVAVALLLVTTSFVTTTDRETPENSPRYAMTGDNLPNIQSPHRSSVPYVTGVGLRGLQLQQKTLDSLAERLTLANRNSMFEMLGQQKKANFGRRFGQVPYTRNVMNVRGGANRHYVLPNISTNRSLVNDAAF